MIFGRKPEIIYLDVPVLDLRLLDPERWILGRLSFNADHGKVLRVDPDFPAIEKFVLAFRKQAQHILHARGCVVHVRGWVGSIRCISP